MFARVTHEQLPSVVTYSTVVIVLRRIHTLIVVGTLHTSIHQRTHINTSTHAHRTESHCTRNAPSHLTPSHIARASHGTPRTPHHAHTHTHRVTSHAHRPSHLARASHRVTSHRVTPHRVTSHRVTSHQVTLHRATPHRVTLHAHCTSVNTQDHASKRTNERCTHVLRPVRSVNGCGGSWCGGSWCGGSWCDGSWCGGSWCGGSSCDGSWCGGCTRTLHAQRASKVSTHTRNTQARLAHARANNRATGVHNHMNRPGQPE